MLFYKASFFIQYQYIHFFAYFTFFLRSYLSLKYDLIVTSVTYSINKISSLFFLFWVFKYWMYFLMKLIYIFQEALSGLRFCGEFLQWTYQNTLTSIHLDNHLNNLLFCQYLFFFLDFYLHYFFLFPPSFPLFIKQINTIYFPNIIYKMHSYNLILGIFYDRIWL